uniref:SWIB/MDM2 domain-containing protein n=1 Tax=Marseillevirus LCMAC103 TaxID=2506604 RepID=A0A481YUY0_9VIRU|nr:MAG: SWIB/MDM2 domain-containing protein [Marseillevirus LCMAC103]
MPPTKPRKRAKKSTGKAKAKPPAPAAAPPAAAKQKSKAPAKLPVPVPLPLPSPDPVPHAVPAEEAKSESPKPRPRSVVTIETFLALVNAAHEKCTAAIDKQKKQPPGKGTSIRVLKSVRRDLREIAAKAPKLAKSKNRRRPGLGGAGGKNSGLMTPKRITKELATFLKVPADREISRIEVTRAINAYVHMKPGESRPDILVWSYLNEGGKRDLQNPGDKRIILPDAALSKLLNYPAYKKAVSDGTVTEKRKIKSSGDTDVVTVTSADMLYRTVQKLIQVHFA